MDYRLSCPEMAFCALTLTAIPYALRHWEISNQAPEFQKWGHRIVAVLEACPVLGLIVAIIERTVARILDVSQQQNNGVLRRPPPPPPAFPQERIASLAPVDPSHRWRVTREEVFGNHGTTAYLVCRDEHGAEYYKPMDPPSTWIIYTFFPKKIINSTLLIAEVPSALDERVTHITIEKNCIKITTHPPRERDDPSRANLSNCHVIIRNNTSADLAITIPGNFCDPVTLPANEHRQKWLRNFEKITKLPFFNSQLFIFTIGLSQAKAKHVAQDSSSLTPIDRLVRNPLYDDKNFLSKMLVPFMQ